MKKNLLLLLYSILLLSCNLNETPEFVRVSTIKIADYNPDNITLASSLVFNNPNHVGGILQADNIKVFVNDMDMGYINSPDFIVPALEEFTVPIEFIFSYQDILKDTQNLLKNILNAATDKKIEVRYVGILTYKLNVFSYDYPLDYSQEISLKKDY